MAKSSSRITSVSKYQIVKNYIKTTGVDTGTGYYKMSTNNIGTAGKFAGKFNLVNFEGGGQIGFSNKKLNKQDFENQLLINGYLPIEIRKIPTAKIRINQDLVNQQIKSAYRRMDTKALHKLKAMQRGYEFELLRRIS